MNKIYINLNPRKQKIGNIIFQKLAVWTPFIRIAVIVMFFVVVIINVVVIAKLVISRSYEQKWQGFKDKFETISKIKSETENLIEEDKALRKVSAPRYQTAKIFEDIFSVLPSNIWFKALNFQEGSLKLEGYVVPWGEDYLVSLVDKFIKPLKTKEYFSSLFKNINLKQSQRKNFYGVEVLEFAIECTN